MREFIPRSLQSLKFLTPFLSARACQKIHLGEVVEVTVVNDWVSIEADLTGTSPRAR